MKKLYFALLLLILGAAPFGAEAQYVVIREVWPSFRVPAVTEFQPVPGRPGKIALAIQTGMIKINNLDSVSQTPRTMMDIRGRVQASGEMGLLGLAFHPRYPIVNKIYVNYVADIGLSTRRTIIASFNVDTARLVVDTASRTEIITYSQPYTNHKGGKIEFGPDSMLYIAAGDGGSGDDPQANGQNKRVLLAKILRIDVNRRDSGKQYAIPPDNPFADSTNGIRREIYTYGMRNPWRFSWDVPTHRLWVGDVGQNTREEIDTVVSGGNYGWRNCEGKINNPAYPGTCAALHAISPVWDYDHSLGISITGGYVYRGSLIPYLYGHYIYADYGSGRIWGLEVTDSSVVNTLLVIAHAQGTNPANTYTFGRDIHGELYICHGPNGAIFRLEPDLTALAKSQPGLGQATIYPNPTQDKATLDLKLDAATPVQALLVTADGKEVATLFARRTLAAGTHKLTLSTAGIAAGSYLVRIQTGQGVMMRRLAVVR